MNEYILFYEGNGINSVFSIQTSPMRECSLKLHRERGCYKVQKMMANAEGGGGGGAGGDKKIRNWKTASICELLSCGGGGGGGGVGGGGERENEQVIDYNWKA